MCSQNLRRHSFYRLSLSKQICKLGPENRNWASSRKTVCAKSWEQRKSPPTLASTYFSGFVLHSREQHMSYIRRLLMSLVSELLKPWQIRIFVVLLSSLSQSCRCFQTLSDAGLGQTSHKSLRKHSSSRGCHAKMPPTHLVLAM